MEKCPFCGRIETFESTQDPDIERPHYYTCGTEPGYRGKQCLEDEITTLRQLLKVLISVAENFIQHSQPLSSFNLQFFRKAFNDIIVSDDLKKLEVK